MTFWEGLHLRGSRHEAIIKNELEKGVKIDRFWTCAGVEMDEGAVRPQSYAAPHSICL